MGHLVGSNLIAGGPGGQKDPVGDFEKTEGLRMVWLNLKLWSSLA